MIKMQYTSVKEMGKWTFLKKKKNSMLKGLFFLIHIKQFVFAFLNDNENSSNASKNTMYIRIY